MNEGTRKRLFLLQGALLLASALVGCTEQTSGPEAPSDEAPVVAGRRPDIDAPVSEKRPSSPVATIGGAQQSIYRIRQPKSRVAVGARVIIGGPAVQVTAASADTLWIQEAGDSGRCETGNDVVAYRAITVTSKSLIPEVERGQIVEVEGIVTESNGRRTISDAVIRVSGTIGTPYMPHCDRDGDSLASDALDGVLVITAGTTSGQAPPSADSAWSLAPCFGGKPSITIGAAIVSHPAWSPSWHWVSGVLTRSAGAARIEPRSIEDIKGEHANDACL